jgi:hypothetical protein
MNKVALWPKGIARLLLAGFLAWALILPGVAAAYAADGGIISADVGHCAAPGGADDHRHTPVRHPSCSCCIPCRSGQLDGPAGFLSVPPKGADLSFRAAAIVPIDALPIVEASSPAGWIGSWSSRAPPIA